MEARWTTSAAQKIKKLSETPGTVLIVAKLCMIDSKKRKIADKLVQPVIVQNCPFWVYFSIRKIFTPTS